MAQVTEIFPGCFKFEPETDPEKIAAAKKRHEEWRDLFEIVYQTMTEFGPESPEHQWSLIQMKKWQMEQRRKKIDQADHP